MAGFGVADADEKYESISQKSRRSAANAAAVSADGGPAVAVPAWPTQAITPAGPVATRSLV